MLPGAALLLHLLPEGKAHWAMNASGTLSISSKRISEFLTICAEYMFVSGHSSSNMPLLSEVNQGVVIAALTFLISAII